MDQCVAPAVAAGLREAGHDAIHVRTLGLQAADDTILFDLAAADGRAVLTSDGDFGNLLAQRNVARPSVLYLRHDAPVAASSVLKLLLDNLEALEPLLAEGALVVVRRERMRVRRLPLFPSRGNADGD